MFVPKYRYTAGLVQYAVSRKGVIYLEHLCFFILVGSRELPTSPLPSHKYAVDEERFKNKILLHISFNFIILCFCSFFGVIRLV